MIRKLVLILILLLIWAIPTLAKVNINGIAQKGGLTITTSPTVSYKTVQTYPNCTITVYNHGTLTLSTLNSDDVGTVKANPFTANSDASYNFYIDIGRYDIKFSGTGITTPFSLSDVTIGSSGGGTVTSVVLYASEFGVKAQADDAIDDYAALQALINSVTTDDHLPLQAPSNGLTATIQLPSGKILISHPLQIPNALTLRGDPAGGTSLYSSYGSGYLLNLAPDYTVTNSTPNNIQTGTSLATGSGVSMKIGNNLQYLPLNTESAIDNISTLGTFDIEFFLKRTTSSGASGTTILQSGADLGVVKNVSVRVGEYDNGLYVVWNNVNHFSAPTLMTTGTTYAIEVSYDGSNVRGFIDGVQVLSFAATGNVPQKPYEVVSIGRDIIDLSGQVSGTGITDGYIDSVRFSNIARHTAGFTKPTSKFTSDANTLFLTNFDNLQSPFVVGHSGTANRDAWIFVGGIPQFYFANGSTVDNIKFSGFNGGSGLHLENTINGTYNNLKLDTTYYGITFTGVTYGSKINGVYGTSLANCWTQVAQSEATYATGVNIASNKGIVFYTNGAVGGVYSGFLITPNNGAYGSIFVAGSNDVNFYHAQIDDEGQDPSLVYQVIINGAHVKFFGGLLTQSGNTNPLINCGGLSTQAGTVSLFGTHVLVPNGMSELIKFYNSPADHAAVYGITRVNKTVPISLTMQYIDMPDKTMLFSNLSGIAIGSSTYCSDCNVASPCTGSGSGAFAFKNAAGVVNCPF